MANHMHDCSSHTHDPHLQTKGLKTSIGIVLVFMCIELLGAWAANSLALLSDALHLFADVGALLFALFIVKITKRPTTPGMSYGYHRAEILGGLASALSLCILSGFLIYEAAHRFIHPEEVAGPIVLVIATLGLFANVIILRTLHPAQGHSLNMRSAYLHVIGDLLGSIGVIISGAVLWLTDWSPIDPLVTILFSAAILYHAWIVIRQTCSILMESTPKHIDPIAIQRDLASIPGVREVHDLHVWSVSSKRVALSVHLVAERTEKALQAAHKILEEKHHIRHMTVQVEDPTHFESRYCYDCSNGNAKP